MKNSKTKASAASTVPETKPETSANGLVDFDKLRQDVEHAASVLKAKQEALRDGAKIKIIKCLDDAIGALDSVGPNYGTEVMKDKDILNRVGRLTVLVTKKIPKVWDMIEDRNGAGADKTGRRERSNFTPDDLFNYIADSSIPSDSKTSGAIIKHFSTTAATLTKKMKPLLDAKRVSKKESRDPWTVSNA